jgi:DNA-binding response OmpR family regulator
MFTAMNGEQDELQAIYAGAQDFLSKPFDPVDLVARVGRILKLREGRPGHVDLRQAVAGEPIPAPVVRRLI